MMGLLLCELAALCTSTSSHKRTDNKKKQAKDTEKLHQGFTFISHFSMYGWNKEFTDVWRHQRFWFVHQLLPTIRKELLFLSKHHPGLGSPTRGGGAFAARPLKKLTKHHLHRPRTSYISFRRPRSFLNSEEIRASIMYFSSDYL